MLTGLQCELQALVLSSFNSSMMMLRVLATAIAYPYRKDVLDDDFLK